jgi:hypothetical protein
MTASPCVPVSATSFEPSGENRWNVPSATVTPPARLLRRSVSTTPPRLGRADRRKRPSGETRGSSPASSPSVRSAVAVARFHTRWSKVRPSTIVRPSADQSKVGVSTSPSASRATGLPEGTSRIRTAPRSSSSATWLPSGEKNTSLSGRTAVHRPRSRPSCASHSASSRRTDAVPSTLPSRDRRIAARCTVTVPRCFPPASKRWTIVASLSWSGRSSATKPPSSVKARYPSRPGPPSGMATPGAPVERPAP